MRFSQAMYGIREAERFLAPVLQISRVAQIPSDRLISWSGRLPGIYRDVYYALEYQYLLDNGQYSYLLSDGAFLQFYYRFGADDSLVAARLAYYPPPFRLSVKASDFLDGAERAAEVGDDQAFDHLFNWYEMIDESRDQPLNTSHLRFDFDIDARSHAPAHLQFGAMQQIRIPASSVPLPLAYLELLGGCLGCASTIDLPSLTHARNNSHQLRREQGILSLDSA